MQIRKMNCPGAIRSYEEISGRFSAFLDNFGVFWGNSSESAGVTSQPGTLPLRLAELGLVHRAERTGQLHGLMRVREFTQDDAHIFCTLSQVQSEILSVLELMDKVYGVLGLQYRLELSTRPLDRIGSEEVWNTAEAALESALKAQGLPYEVNAGDGAFYGPKIDVHVQDRMGRSWQCGTIQVDFNLPERFNLWVNNHGQKVRPVMIHRVIYGSIERFLGILTEHFKGRFPLWLSPKQVRVIPLKGEYNEAARSIGRQLKAAGLRTDGDFREETVRKRVKVATLDLVPYTVVVGAREAAGGDLHVKRLGGEDFELPLEYFIRFVQKKVERKSLTY